MLFAILGRIARRQKNEKSLTLEIVLLRKSGIGRKEETLCILVVTYYFHLKFCLAFCHGNEIHESTFQILIFKDNKFLMPDGYTGNIQEK